MDLDSYIARYTGENRLWRLLSIAAAGPQQEGGSCLDLALRKHALNLAERQMRQECNTFLYREVFKGREEGVGMRMDPKVFEGLPAYDEDWVRATEKSNRENRHVLEGRVSTAQTRLHKDAIRIAYLALAEHDAQTGRDNHQSISEGMVIAGGSDDRTSVFNPNKKANVNAVLFRAMDFCSTRLQTAQIGLLIIESAMNAGDFVTVRDYVDRLGMTLKSLRSMNAASNNNSSSDPSSYQESIIAEIDIKVQIAKGIERMISGDYRGAASVFVPLVMKGSGCGNSSKQHNNNDHHLLHWPGVTAPEDVALYAGLMCLVTSDRSKMLALADHPEALELVPSVKELLLYWSRANYAPCMRAFSEVSYSSLATPTLSQPLLPLGGVVDIYLTPTRWNALIETVRETCLVEYLRPYQRVKLESLQDLFFPSTASDNNLDTVIDSLADLMDRRLLPPTTRLDCRENILFQVESSCDPGPKISAMEERVLDDSHAMLVRLGCLEHDLAVTANPGSGGGRRGKTGKAGGFGSDLARGNRRQRGQQLISAGAAARGPGMMTDSSDSEDGGNYQSYEEQVEAAQVEAAIAASVRDVGDTQMIDADPPSPSRNAAMNPEDCY